MRKLSDSLINFDRSFGNIEEVKDYISSLEKKGYARIVENGVGYIKFPLGNQYSPSQLETFVMNQKLDFENKEHIQIINAFNLFEAYELKFELEANKCLFDLFKEADRAGKILQYSKNRKEILEAERAIEMLDNALEEEIFCC